MIVLFAAVALGADCDVTTSRDALETKLEAASTAFEAADLKAFEEAVEDARGSLPCLEVVAAPSLAASMHRFEGLSAFVASDPDRAKIAFGSARRLERDYQFPGNLVPNGHPILALYQGADPSSVSEEVPAPSSGALRFDGRPTRQRPQTHSTIFQRVDGTTVQSTRYLWPGDPLPAYPVPEVATPKRSPRTPLLIGAALSVVGGGALLAAAGGTNAKYYDDGTTLADIDRLRSRNNGLLVASGIALTVGVGTGAAGLAVGR